MHVVTLAIDLSDRPMGATNSSNTAIRLVNQIRVRETVKRGLLGIPRAKASG